jgi:hypothetical protein
MALATVLGGVLGDNQSKRSSDLEGQYLRKNTAIWDELEIPDIEKQRLALEMYGDPELESAFLQDQSEYGSINLDPATRDAQMQALAQLQNISEQGGMDSVDRARMADITGQAASMAQGQREAIGQNMQARGMAGSGLELVQQQMANQNAAQMANQGGLQTAAAAQQRALDAIMNAGNLGGQMRGQDYSIASDRAKAQDAINNFNTQNRQGVAGRNIERTNTTNNTNVDLRNNQQSFNKGLSQRNFENQVAKAQGQTGANAAVSERYGNDARATQQKYAGYGKAQDDMGMEVLGAMGGMFSM